MKMFIHYYFSLFFILNIIVFNYKDIIILFFKYIKIEIIASKNNLLNNYIISFNKPRKERLIGYGKRILLKILFIYNFQIFHLSKAQFKKFLAVIE